MMFPDWLVWLLTLLMWLPWLVLIGVITLALTLPKTQKGKVLAILTIVVILGAVYVLVNIQDWLNARRVQAEFQKHCKTAGEFIHQTASNVDGVLFSSKSGDIKRFFYDDEKEFLSYRYIDKLDYHDGMRYRHTGRLKFYENGRKGSGQWRDSFYLDKAPAPEPAPRYGVIYDDHRDEDGITRVSLKVIDSSTNEVMAEKIVYKLNYSAPGKTINDVCPKFSPPTRVIGKTTYLILPLRSPEKDFIKEVLKPSPPPSKICEVRVTAFQQYPGIYSDPRTGKRNFSYTVRLENTGTVPLRLTSYHKIITGENSEVTHQYGRGDGFNSHSRLPVLAPGMARESTLYPIIDTPVRSIRGSIRGSYTMMMEHGPCETPEFELKLR
jgi:ApaG protein